ncbi:bifunctional monodehydroascorbate reductase and carbonic anhydrase nectarin-3-like [Hibiscus syriacus]|uniref:histidine--tRNA ligase n=1 Tax=Hibiscus syriacus TaxID=106335 RepID=A0A6A2YA94_HIBSY|nr:histidine--tRNA ligase, chloroplastic/mitochondrial-like [Hibiscus syriacus]KAE8679385.1 bifunctional monodehydroascorbate reductase and carbonic anhydrase nectarin-3-like [Hibiscus syriacus]
MPPLPSPLLNPRLSLSLKPLLIFSQSSLAPREFQIPRQLVSVKRRTFSSLASEHSSDNRGRSGGGGRSGALSPSPVAEEIQRIDVNPPKGTRDFPPEDMRLRKWLFNHFREVSRLFGFEEVDYPVLESEALFIRKAGEEIRDQLYCFEDRGNRRVALRPELTPSLARLVIQKGKSLSLPLKWFAIGQCWRYERMTRGRRREHYQWNMDILGVPEVTAEAELIASIVTFFKRTGITESDVGFKVSSRKVLQEVLRCYSVPENLFGKVCIVIDKIEKIPIDEIKRELNVTGLSEEAIEELFQVLSIKSLTKLEEILGGAGEAIADLKQLFSLAEKFGCSEWIQFDASVVRGLAYYTGIIFECFDRDGKLRAICGGGRYDRLLSTFGGDNVPACGFGFGDAVIVELLKEKGLLPELSLEVDNIVCALDRDLQGVAAIVATKLREKGQSVDLVLESRPLKWVFKRAARTNAQRLILVGNTEWQKGMVVVKVLSSGEQNEIKLDELE